MNDDQELTRGGKIIQKRGPSKKIQAMMDKFEGYLHIKNLAKDIDWKELLKWIKNKP